MIKNYQFYTTLKQQLILLTPLLFTIIALPIGVIFILHLSLSNIATYIVFIFFFLIDALPTFVLHLQYWLENHDSILNIDIVKQEFNYSTSKQKLNYSFSDIAKVDYYRNLGKGSGWHSFGQYRYYKITCTNKTKIIVTCLMINDIENTLEILLKVKAEQHAKWLCLIDRA